MNARLKPAVPLLFLLAICMSALAQQTIGTISTADANVSGTLEVASGQATLVGSSTITARDRSASITLARGGSIRVCQTSRIRLTQGQAAAPIDNAPLLLALEKGAIEIRMAAGYGDAILTPDLRIIAATPGPLDLQLRMTPSGDTCVENKPGTASQPAPTLDLTDAFSDQHYQLRPGQHVLFEHASLREVVDHETSSCGCPDAPSDPTANSLAAAMLAPGTPQTAAAQKFPFPTAVSEGLSPAPTPAAEPAGQAHVQVAGSLIYNPNDRDRPLQQASTPAAAAATPALAQPKQKPHGIFHAIGSFFKNLFGDSNP